MQLFDWFVVSLFFVTMIGVGWWSTSRIRNTKDYFTGAEVDLPAPLGPAKMINFGCPLIVTVHGFLFIPAYSTGI